MDFFSTMRNVSHPIGSFISFDGMFRFIACTSNFPYGNPQFVGFVGPDRNVYRIPSCAFAQLCQERKI